MKIRVTIVIDEDLLKSLDLKAFEQGRSRSNMIDQILKSDLKEINSQAVSAPTDD